MVHTSELVRKQIVAMKAEVFEIGLFRVASAVDGHDAEMLPRAWDPETLLRSIAWLRLENMRGRNIYIRPQGEHQLSLVDDLTKSAIDRMKAEGFQPAAIVETSPRNFQAWLNHGERLTKEVGTAVARALAIDSRVIRTRRTGAISDDSPASPTRKTSTASRTGCFPSSA